MFLLVPAHPGIPGQRAVKRLLLLLLVDIITTSTYVITFPTTDLLISYTVIPLCTGIL